MSPRAPHLDACPRCYRRGIPPGLTAIRRNTLVAAYRCPRCRHGWWTAWDLTDRTRQETAA